MNIAAAIELYKSGGGESASPALRKVINQLINDNVRTQFDNDSYVDALVLTDVMFDRSQNSVRWLAGSGLAQFLITLESSFVELLTRLRNSTGRVKILILDSQLPEWLESLQNEYKGTLSIRHAHAKSEIPHFIVCDGKMAREEQPHPIIDENSMAEAIKAKVSFNDPGKAKVLENYFESLWQAVESYPINKGK